MYDFRFEIFSNHKSKDKSLRKSRKNSGLTKALVISAGYKDNLFRGLYLSGHLTGAFNHSEKTSQIILQGFHLIFLQLRNSTQF